jgi:hypothetical protein
MFPLDMPLQHSCTMGSSVKNILLTEKAEDMLSVLVNWPPKIGPDPRRLSSLTWWQVTETVISIITWIVFPIVLVNVIVIEHDLMLLQVDIVINVNDRRNTRATVGVVFVAGVDGR